MLDDAGRAISGLGKGLWQSLSKGRSAGGTSVKAFDIVEYGAKAPGFEKHHGVLDVWAKNNVAGYKSYAADSPSIVLTKPQHDATRRVFRDWLEKKTGKRVGGSVDWTKVSAEEAQDLSDAMFKAAGVPEAARRAYFERFANYVFDLK